MTSTSTQTAIEHKTVYKVRSADGEQTFDSRHQAAVHVVEQLHNAETAIQTDDQTTFHGAISWHTEQVPATYLDQLLAAYGGGQANDDWEIDRSHRYLLVEESRHDGTYWLTSHPSVAAAARYVDGQEHPEDWKTLGLYDLETRRKLDAQQTTRFDK